MNERLTVVVTGLPRSGTSLMMQMLEAGGVPPLTDGARAPDQSNPRGYYELEAVKALAKDASCLGAAPGHAVKVIHRLVRHLPADQTYAFILVRRDPGEVVASQQAMLERIGNTGAALNPSRLTALFESELRQAVDHARAYEGSRLLEVEHSRAIAAPDDTAASIVAFLRAGDTPWEGPLDDKSMARAVDPALHRHRRSI